MKIKSFIVHSVAKLVMIAAKEASGTASWYGSGQPEEPEVLKAYFSNVKDIEKLDKQ
jgi:cyclic lactone autoinducer peptide